MKTIITLLLGMLITFSLPITAQNQSPALRAYTKWQNETLAKQERGLATPHYCLASITQRVDNATAQIDFLAAGIMNSFTLEIQPLQINQQDKGTYLKIGEKTVTSASGFSSNDMSQTELRAIASVPSQANALEVKWFVNDGQPRKQFTAIMSLDTKPAENIMSVITK